MILIPTIFSALVIVTTFLEFFDKPPNDEHKSSSLNMHLAMKSPYYRRWPDHIYPFPLSDASYLHNLCLDHSLYINHERNDDLPLTFSENSFKYTFSPMENPIFEKNNS